MQPHSFALQTGAQIKPVCARKSKKAFSYKTHRHNVCNLTLLQSSGCLPPPCAGGRSILGFTGEPYSAAGEFMWERSQENTHLYIWLCKEELLRMTVHNKKLQHIRHQGQKTGKQASGRSPVGKNVALRNQKN